MSEKAILFILVACAGLLLTAATASPAVTPEMRRTVMAGGGQPVADGGRFVLRSTLGEPIAGPLVADTGKQLASGYWQKLPGDYKIFLPLIDK